MKTLPLLKTAAAWCGSALFASTLFAQVGHTWPSEKKVVIDPVTGTPLTFLTSTPVGDSKIYQTHPDWTSDGQWLIFRSNRAAGQAFAVNEQTGQIVQVTDKGYTGMLCVARKSMKLYIMRDLSAPVDVGRDPYIDNAAAAIAAGSTGPTPAPEPGLRRGFRPRGPFQIVEIDLGGLFADVTAGTVKGGEAYERVCGTTPAGMHATGNMGLDADENDVYFGITGQELMSQLPPDKPIEKPYGPRNMGAGPSGLASMNLTTGEVKTICVVPFQIGHVQTNPWKHGEIVFCWETGGKAPQRTWTVMADGTGLRPLWPEAPYDWVTHEAVITKDEVAIAILYTHTPLGGFGRRGRGPQGDQTGQPVPAVQPAPAVAADQPAPAGQAAPGGQPPAAGQGGGRRGRGNNGGSWGTANPGTDEHATGVGIVNLRTHEMRIVGQVPLGDPGRSIWHVNGSPDGRWATADDFMYRLWIIDRHTGEMELLASMGTRPLSERGKSADHIHPTFSADSTKIEIQSAMLSENERSLNICVVPLPKAWLARTYDNKAALLGQ
jgi:oligogalacturonide lyase